MGMVVILIGNVTYYITPPGLWLAEGGPAPFLIRHDGQVQIPLLFGRQLSITPSNVEDGLDHRPRNHE
jgi:hypothetical protein